MLSVMHYHVGKRLCIHNLCRDTKRRTVEELVQSTLTFISLMDLKENLPLVVSILKSVQVEDLSCFTDNSR